MSTYVGKFFTAVSSALEFNSATLSGAMDIVVIEDANGDRHSTPFHVRFGKLQLLKSRGIPIHIELNGSPTHLRMLLGAAGEAYFYNPPHDAATAASSPCGLLHSPIADAFQPHSDPNAIVPAVSAPLRLMHTPILSLPVRSSSYPIPRPSPVTASASSASSLGSSRRALSQVPPHVPLHRKSHVPIIANEPLSCRVGDVSPTDDYHFSHGSDSEVELTRALRGGESEIVDGPRSPPVLPSMSRRQWKSSALPSSSALRRMPSVGNDPVSPPDDGSEHDNSALFDLPESPRSQSASTSGLVVPLEDESLTICASIQDVVVEEDRKLEFRSVDGYDPDDDVAGMDGLQTHVTRVLSSSASLSVPQSFNEPPPQSIDIPGEDDAATAFPSDTDPPSDHDDVVVMSLCGSLLAPDMHEDQIMELFERHRVTFPAFTANPSLLFHPSMLFRIDNRIVELRVAAPLLFAALAFNERMDIDILSRMTTPPVKQEAPKSPPTPHRSFSWFGWTSSVVGEPLLEEDEINALDAKKEAVLSEEGETVEVVHETETERYCVNEHLLTTEGSIVLLGAEIDERIAAMENDTDAHRIEGRGPDDALAEVRSEEVKGGVETVIDDLTNKNNIDAEGRSKAESSDMNADYLSLTPTTEQLKSLDLQPGANTLRFYVEASSVELNCRIFLWSCHSKIVISDVDGTITRSDVLGHLLPAVGRDWSQVGVAGLYTQIEKNGYKLLYLTARPIGQAGQTRTFLHSVMQGSAKLPNGPVLMSPNRLMESFAREVIRRKPHEFKIAALREVRCLFSPDYNPFHAGFGNRDTDVISYRAVGLIPQRIFVVNPQGELVVMKAKFESAASYSTLQDLVESVFPDISGEEGHEKIKTLTENATYNDWNYWRGQLPELDFAELLLQQM